MKLTVAIAALATVLTMSCRSRHHDVVIERPATQPQTVIIEKEHVHSATCGHYYHNGVWYAEPEHIHIVEIR